MPGQTLPRKIFKSIFLQRISILRKYFWIFLKNRKCARKDSSMQWCFENSKMQWKNFKSQEKQIWRKIKYEISNDLPSARARRFESDERDLSPAFGYHYSARPGELDEDELATLRHIFLAHLFLDRVVIGPSGWGHVHSRVDSRHEPAGSRNYASSCRGI